MTMIHLFALKVRLKPLFLCKEA